VSVTTNELLQTLTAQIVAGGTVSPIGRLDLDPTLGQPFYIVPSETQRPRSVSQTLIQNAMVLHLGTFELPGQAEAEAAAAAAAEEAAAEAEAAGEPPPPEAAPVVVPPDVITLVVSYQDAVTLNYLVLNGARLSLAMRPAEDATISETEAVTLQFLLDQYNIFVPARQPYGLEPRIDQLLFPALPNDAQP
jgi:pilus assembly protein CpaB